MNKCLKSKILEHVRNRRFQTKAQGLSINVIIIAAIALIVLVVLVAIFAGRIGLFGEGVAKIGKNCEEYYSVDENGEEYPATWEDDCVDPKPKRIFTVLDATEHPSEQCCVAWPAKSVLRTQ